MKTYTDIKQSKKLAEFLSIYSADGFYEAQHNHLTDKWEYILFPNNEWASPEVVIPCRSLSALLEIIPNQIDGFLFLLFPNNEDWSCCYENEDAGYFDVKTKYGTYGENPVDACYGMILKLHEQKLL